MIIGKRHLVLAALVLALGAAVYLNWQFAPSDVLIDSAVSGTSDTSQLGDAQYVAVSPQVSAADSPSVEDGEAVETGKKNTYFDEARTDREKTRNEALATLQEIIGDPSLNESQRAEAVSTAAQMAANMEKEAAIETLIKAKGYSNCVVVISETQVNVIIPAKDGGLTSADTAIIRDIVIGQVDVSPSCIKIIEAK